MRVVQAVCTDLRTRAPGQHVRILERRGAILRHSMHTGKEQLKKEGITVTFTMLLAEHTFAGNALTMHNGATPYNARMGRQPKMLPDILSAREDTAEGPGRYMHRTEPERSHCRRS